VEGGRFTSVTWHPENPLQILLTTKSLSTLPFLKETAPFTLLVSAEVISYSFRWETCATATIAPRDTGTVAVVDGCEPLLLLRVASPCDPYHSFYPSHAVQDAKRPASHVFS
jgi:elongator complex protein 1